MLGESKYKEPKKVLKDLKDQPPQQSLPLSPLHEPLHWRAKRDMRAYIFFLQSFLRNGLSLGYVERIKS